MTPRERVHSAFRHEEPDRTPIFERLIKPPTDRVILGRPAVHADDWPTYMRTWARDGWQATMEQQALDEFEIAQRLGFDMVSLGTNPPASAPQPIELDEWNFRQGDDVLRYHPESGVVENLTSRTRSNDEWERNFRDSIEREYEAPVVEDDQLYIWRRIQQLIDEAQLDLAIYVSAYVIPVAALPPFAIEWFLTEPDTLGRFYEHQSNRIIDLGRQYVSEGADVVGLGGDFAGDKGSVISPAAYREQVVPHIRRQSDAMHEFGAWTTNTTDGILWDVLPDFLDGAGVDGYGEIDVAAGMDLARLKLEWGDRYTFLGNLDIRHVLCSGTTEDARTHMIKCIEDGQGNGGHVIMTSNVVHEDVKPELYLAALSAYREYFRLPDLEISETVYGV
jgi:hypothetical protein